MKKWKVVGAGVLSLSVVVDGKSELCHLNATSEPFTPVVDLNFQRARKAGRLKQVTVDVPSSEEVTKKIPAPQSIAVEQKPVESESDSVKVVEEEPVAKKTKKSSSKAKADPEDAPSQDIPNLDGLI